MSDYSQSPSVENYNDADPQDDNELGVSRSSNLNQLDIDNMSDDSDLSEVDEAQFDDFDAANVALDDRPAIAVDESNVALLGTHKRKRAATEVDDPAKKKKKVNRREKIRKPRKKDSDDGFSGGEEIDGKRERKKRSVIEKKGAAKASKRDATPENEENLSPEEIRKRNLDKAMDEALRNPNRRRRKKDEINLEEMADAEIAEVKYLMDKAAQNDSDARKDEDPAKRKPATEKLRLLPLVMRLLNRSNLAHLLVDPETNFLKSVKFFIEPLIDGSLPAYNIQREIFAALGRLPIDYESLKASGIGSVVTFYMKSKRVELSIKRQAERLVSEWSRPILKRSEKYSDLKYTTAAYDPSSNLPIRSSQLPSTTQASLGQPRSAAAKLEAFLAPSKATNRARVQAANTSYSIVPQSVIPQKLTNAQTLANAKPLGHANDSRFRKMIAKDKLRK
ncbi:MAG: Transcription factor iws1 [Trizodia sp. TS-e1964]|nr:MAG: Transcription factor iws1 [Trizodia sp. TS-e1964]